MSKPILPIVLALVLSMPALVLQASAEEFDVAYTYKKKCAVCHGADGVPKKFAKGSPAFNDPAWKDAVSIQDIEKSIAEGKGKMPGFAKRFTPEELRALAEYLKGL